MQHKGNIFYTLLLLCRVFANDTVVAKHNAPNPPRGSPRGGLFLQRLAWNLRNKYSNDCDSWGGPPGGLTAGPGCFVGLTRRPMGEKGIQCLMMMVRRKALFLFRRLISFVRHIVSDADISKLLAMATDTGPGKPMTPRDKGDGRWEWKLAAGEKPKYEGRGNECSKRYFVSTVCRGR